MMDIKKVLFLCFIHFLIKRRQVVVLLHLQINLLLIMNNQLENYTGQGLIFVLKKQFILHSETIFGVLIQLICNQKSNLDKGFRYLLRVIDICSKYDWVIALKDKKEGVTMHFKKYQMINNVANQRKHGQIKEANAITVLLKNG